jgi:hypothetical protein
VESPVPLIDGSWCQMTHRRLMDQKATSLAYSGTDEARMHAMVPVVPSYRVHSDNKERRCAHPRTNAHTRAQQPAAPPPELSNAGRDLTHACRAKGMTECAAAMFSTE